MRFYTLGKVCICIRKYVTVLEMPTHFVASELALVKPGPRTRCVFLHPHKVCK
jgi:hypothetical protein